MEERELSYILGGNVNRYSHYWEWYEGSLKTKSRVIIWSCNLTLELQRKPNLKGYVYPNVHGSTIYNSQDMEAT